MIFLTVGHDIPFDRLTRAMDDWCQETGRADVFGQIAHIGQEGYRPQHFKWHEFLEPEEFKHQFETADLIVAHAGTGTIITALMLNKPVIIMPRRGDLNETRNNHQVATAERFAPRLGIDIAMDATELGEVLNKSGAHQHQAGTGPTGASPFAKPPLIEALRDFIFQREPS